MRARAFCPGHVTGFFEVCEGRDLVSTGSRGAGMCLSLGATSTVTLRPAKRTSITITLDGKERRAEVTRSALARILGREPARIEVHTKLDLPMSQGFGMSAAGALSASLALAHLLGRSRQEAFEAAHIAEVECGSGLGDVSALHKGGITVRVLPGLPPVGKVYRIRGRPAVVLCVVGRRLLTRSVLNDPEKRKAVISSGARLVDELMKKPTLERLMRLSQRFAFDSGLVSTRVAEAISAAEQWGMASMAMLGNSVFAVGDQAGLVDALSRFGAVYRCRVDTLGPRLLNPEHDPRRE